MTDDFDPDDMLAAEYAIGLLDTQDCDAALRRVTTDPAFASRVAEWEGLMSQMVDLEPVDPPHAAKAALMAQLFPQVAQVSIWKRLGIWQAISGGAVAAFILLGVMMLQAPPQPQSGPLYTAEIVSEAGDFRVIALVDMAQSEVILTRTAGTAPDGRILQVWAHGPDEPAQSVGLWPEGESVRLTLPDDIAAVRGTLTLGVSEEPPGGSLTGQPSGRVFGTVDIQNVSSAI